MKKEIKGFIIGSITTFILTATVGFATGTFKTIDVYENNVKIYANGNEVNSPNFTYNDTTYVPLRAVLELMDCRINYEDETKSVYASNRYRPGSEVLLKDNSTLYDTVVNWDTLDTYINYKLLSHAGIVDIDATLNSEYLTYSTQTLNENNYNSSLPNGYAGSSHLSTITSSSFPLYLYSDEDKPVFLGKLTNNEFDKDSVNNEFGNYGSSFSKTSIFNEFSSYGSALSKYSAFNKLATNPPKILDEKFNVVGRLTNNSTFTNGYTWEQIDQLMK